MKTDVLVPCLVAKISLKDLSKDLIDLDLVPNQLDSGIISSLSVKKFETNFRLPKRYSDQYATLTPMEGDKLYGNYRDKFSITKVCRKYVPFCIYKFKDSVEVERFTKFLDLTGNIYFIGKRNRVFFQIDFINNESTDRDNVGAIALDSCLQFKSILEDKDIALTTDEYKNYDLISLAKERKWHQKVVMVDMETKKIVHSFGEVPILIEEFFWQPQHSNRFNSGFRNCEFKYSQAIDGIKLLVPTLYKGLIESIDYKTLKEELMVLGIDIGSYDNYQKIFEDDNTPITDKDLEDLMFN